MKLLRRGKPWCLILVAKTRTPNGKHAAFLVATGLCPEELSEEAKRLNNDEHWAKALEQKLLWIVHATKPIVAGLGMTEEVPLEMTNTPGNENADLN